MGTNKKEHHFESVSLLITHYNRSKSLERLLDHYAKLNVSFNEIIVSDDGSKPEHLDYIKKLEDTFDFKLVTTPKNSGLGNNINKGQDAATSKYVLYVQEDFIPLASFVKNFKNGLSIIEGDNEVDVVRFYAYSKFPFLKSFKNGFSEMLFKPLSANIDQITMYSDHPHLKRKNFFEKFGRYPEMKNPEKTEYGMMVSFLKKKGKAYIFDDFKSVFEQINSSSEPSTMQRNYWRNTNGFPISFARIMYRHLKFNYMYYFK
jgi:glycosyltransferase involved in cell wall biosynthesis